jgi:hypothetical protein
MVFVIIAVNFENCAVAICLQNSERYSERVAIWGKMVPEFKQ